MAPAPSRIAPVEGDAFINEINKGPHWTTDLPQEYRDAWGLGHLPVPPPAYDTEPASPTVSSSPPTAPAVPPRRLVRSAWHPDLSSEPGHQAHFHQQDHHAYQSFPDPPRYQDTLQGQQQLRAQDHPHHPHSYHLEYSGPQNQTASQGYLQRQQQLLIQDHPQHPHSHSLEQSVPQKQPAPHSTQSPDSPPPPYPLHPDLSEKLYQLTKKTVDHITNTLGADRLRALALEGPTESAVEELESVGSRYDRELDLLFEGDLDSETQQAIDWMVKEPNDWPLDKSLKSMVNESLQGMINESAEAAVNPSKQSCTSPSPSPSVDVGDTDAVEAPEEPKKRVRSRIHKNKPGRRRMRQRKLKRMALRASNNPEPARGSPGDATPTSIAETIIGSDIDVVRSSSPSPCPSPLPSEGMHVVSSAPAVPEAPPKKKGKIQADKAGDNIPRVSLDAQLTASATSAQEPRVSHVGATSEVENPTGVTTGEDGSPKASEGPSPTVVDGDEATGESFTPNQEYVGPCVIDTEEWRQRTLAHQAAEEEKRAAFLAAAPRVGDVFPHSVDQSENSWTQWPMQGQSVPAQYSHDGGHRTGYQNPWSGVVVGPARDGPMCGFYPACCHHNGNPRCSCCCLHGPAHCWYASDNNFPRNTDRFVAAPPPPAAGRELAPAVASLFEAYRTSKMSPSTKSSSLGEPVSEPIVESVESLFVVDRQSSRASSTSTQAPNEPAVVSSTTNTDTTLDASTIQETTPANNSQMMSLRQAHPGEFLTPEDLKSPSLYFDAKSKNLSSSVLASSESKEASRTTSRKPSTAASNDPEEKGPSMSAEDAPETRNQGCQTMPADAREQSRQPEATGPLAFQTDHIKALFGNPVFADIQLLLSPDPSHPPIIYNLHKAIIAGSPFLCDVMAAKRHRDGGVNHIRAFTGISFSCSHAFTMALQVLYGTPLVNNETLRKSTLQGLGLPDDNGTGTYSFSIERAMVDFALCYAAAGAFLARREITERGIDMAISRISWETAEFILSFAMTPVTYMVTCPDVPFSPISPANSRASSLSAGHGNGNGTPIAGLDHFHDFHYVQAQRAQNAALHFITAAVKPGFELYRRAQAHYTPSRVPPALHTLPGSMLSNPRLEEIRFGNFPSFADLRPTDQGILVPSAMLITLPYRVFLATLDIMKACGNLSTELLKEVLEERESRRLHALRISLRVDSCKVPPVAFAELLYREFATTEPTEHTTDQNEGVLPPIVDRVWTGYDFPNKSALRPRCRASSNGSGPPLASNAS
ncbi:uncharacterized protein N7496_008281 [Penicillium cataractarum]|uniref:Uncharacterized protein n=1 Tax=Penicillium cataractarum TaxID=2100454 RepID=A0A9W9RY48_9EURO|nr:uncharacterized protein N7496_008281 [Penicillium cataractarum]KAJ5368521.1 hypothetical protein N7496_008281 [Penicillium cataractarum]